MASALNEYNFLPFGSAGPRWYTGNTVPTVGNFNVGDMVFNTAITNGGVAMWVCSIAGNTQTGTAPTFRTVSNS